MINIRPINIRPEAYFAAEQAVYNRSCVEANQRAEQAKQRAKEMMRQGEEYYPWDWKNLSEALANAKDSDMKIFASCVNEAIDHNLDQPLTNHLALCALKRIVEDYWYDMALYQARKE